MSEQISVETPENVAFRYDVAGIGSRFLATLIDSLIQGTIYVFIYFLLIAVAAFGLESILPQALIFLIPAIFILAIFLIQFGYYIIFEIITAGQSPGKSLVGLRVIKDNGNPVSALDSIIRNLVRIIDFLPFGYGIGFIVMFLNARSKRLGDFAAGTLVVNDREPVKLSQLQVAAAAIPDRAESGGLEGLQESDIEMIEEFLQRRASLNNAPALAVTLAKSVRARIDSRAIDDAGKLSDEDFLRQVVAAFRRRRSRL